MAESRKNKNKASSNTGWIVGIVIAVIALAALAVGLTFYFVSDNEDEDSLELEDSKLYVGTYMQSCAADEGASSQDWFSNTLYFYVYENGELYSSTIINGLDLYPETYYGFDFTTSEQSSQYREGSFTRGDWGFMDVSDLLPTKALDYGISFWASLDSGNFFSVKVEWNGGPFSTSYFDFTEGGIWFFNSPVEDGYVLTLEGDTPNVVHALIYNEYTKEDK